MSIFTDIGEVGITIVLFSPMFYGKLGIIKGLTFNIIKSSVSFLFKTLCFL